MTSPSDRRTQSAGFTLIEMLVVLAIVALLLAFTPSIVGALLGLRFHSATQALTVELREMQATALGSGREITITIDPKARLWRSSLDGQTHSFPAAFTQLEVRFPGRETAVPALPVMRFLPDGSASAAILTLIGSRQRAQITIDGLIGRVRLDD